MTISPANRAHSSKPAAAGLLLWAHAGHRRTDAAPLHKACIAYYAGSANNKLTTVSRITICVQFLYGIGGSKK